METEHIPLPPHPSLPPSLHHHCCWTIHRPHFISSLWAIFFSVYNTVLERKWQLQHLLPKAKGSSIFVLSFWQVHKIYSTVQGVGGVSSFCRYTFWKHNNHLQLQCCSQKSKFLKVLSRRGGEGQRTPLFCLLMMKQWTTLKENNKFTMAHKAWSHLKNVLEEHNKHRKMLPCNIRSYKEIQYVWPGSTVQSLK